MLVSFVVAAGAALASPLPASSACLNPDGRRAVIEAKFSDDRLMTELADMTLVAERRISRSVDALPMSERDKARLALRLLDSPELAIQRADVARSVEQVFERLESALGSKDETALCSALVETSDLLPVLAAKAEQQQRFVEERVAAETQSRLASLVP